MRPQPWPGIFPAGGLALAAASPQPLAVILQSWGLIPCGKLVVVPMGKLWVVRSVVLPWFGRCGSVAVRAGSLRVRMMVPGGRFIETNIILSLVADGGRWVPGAKIHPILIFIVPGG